MRIENRVSFDRVCEVFLQENPDPTFRATGYAFRLLGAANRQFGDWFTVALYLDDILGVMLPPHRHDALDLIPQSGLLVSDVFRKIELDQQSHDCSRRIEKLSREPASTVFLSAAPLDDPEYSDYRELVGRRYRGLTHLDGLHRLIAWARSDRSEVVAYVAGLGGG
jgi:hypothetical protein